MVLLLLTTGCASPGLSGFFVDLSGTVVEANGTAVTDATVELSASNGVYLGSVTTDDTGAWAYSIYGSTLDGNQLDARVVAEGFADGVASFEINLKSPEIDALQANPGETWTGVARRLSAIVLARKASRATVAGVVRSATSGGAVGGVPLTLQWGWNARDGEQAIDTGTTGDDGGFSFAVDTPGMYTITTGETDDYGGARFPALLTAEGGGATGLIAPVPAPGQLIAALSWGDSPQDLDLHLSAPLRGGSSGEDGNGQYHVWSGAPQHPEDPPAGTDIEAEMVRVDDDGEGPETVEILGAPGEGEVRLTVVDNDDLADDQNLALASSGAVLQVWNGSDFPRYYTVAPGQSAIAWHPVTVAAPAATVWVLEEYIDSIDPSNGKDF